MVDAKDPADPCEAAPGLYAGERLRGYFWTEIGLLAL